MAQSFKKCYVTNEFDDTEDGIWWENSDLDCLDLKSYLEESVGSESETGWTSEEDRELTCLI
jgi:hypothetical protein